MRKILIISFFTLLFVACDDYQEIKPRNVEMFLDEDATQVSGTIQNEVFHQGLHYFQVFTESYKDSVQNKYSAVSNYWLREMIQSNPYANVDSSDISQISLYILGNKLLSPNYFIGKNLADPSEIMDYICKFKMDYKGETYLVNPETGLNDGITMVVNKIKRANEMITDTYTISGKYEKVYFIEFVLNGSLYHSDTASQKRLNTENLNLKMIISMPEA